MYPAFTKVNRADSAGWSRRTWGAYLLILMLAGLAACSGGSGPGSPDAGTTPTAPPPSVGQATLGVAGGSLTGPDGTLIEVPAQALSTDVTIRIARDSTGAPAIPNGWKALSPIYTITPHIEPLNVPVGLTIPYDTTARTDDSTLAIAVANAGEDWQWLPATDTPSGAKAMTRHFSFVAVVQNKGHVTVELIAPVTLQPWPLRTGTGIKSWIVNAPMTLEVRATYTPTPVWKNCAVMSYYLNVSNWGRVGTTGWTVTRVLQNVNKQTPRLPTGVEITPGTTTSFFVPLDSSVNGITEFMFSAICTLRTVPSDSGAVYGTNYGLLSDVLVDIPVGADSPIISQQPQSTSVTAGQGASFNLLASAPNSLSVRWERSNDNGQSWSSVTGSTTGLSIASTALSDSGAQFRAQVCNVMVLGAPVCVSTAIATLTVSPAPVAPVFTQNPSSVAVLAGQTASFSAVASGTPAPQLQWMQGVGASALAVGTPCQGTGTQTACSFTTSALTLAQSGTSFFARASNSARTVESAAATVTVTPAPVAPSIPPTEPADVTVAVGGSVTFSVNASGTAPLSYQWWRNGFAKAGETGRSYTVNNVQIQDNQSYFMVEVMSPSGSAKSRRATLTVIQPVTPPSGGSQAGAISCTGPTNTGWCTVFDTTLASGFTHIPNSGFGLSSVAFGSSNVGLGVSYSSSPGAEMLRTTDGGATWAPVVGASFSGRGSFVNFSGVAFADANTAVATGFDQAAQLFKVYRSTDAGVTWTVAASNAPVAWGAPATPGNLQEVVFVNASTGVINAQGSILRTTDGGATWNLVIPNLTFSYNGGTYNTPDIRKIAKIPGTTILWAFVVDRSLGFPGRMVRSTDGGLNWSQVYTVAVPIDPIGRAMSFANANIGVMADNNSGGAIYQTTDGGQTWTQVSNFQANGVILNPDGTGVAVGGSIAYTSDFGATWQLAQSGTANSLSSVTSPAAGRYIAVGSDIILRNIQSGTGP